MLRSFARSDSPFLFSLLQRHFPEENTLLGFRPEAFEKIVRRIFRWDMRLLFGIADVLRRPLAKMLVIEADGHLAATTLVTFPPNAGYVSMVMVDDPYRRRGYAKKLLEAAARESRRAGRAWVVLDVLTHNAPARQLYEQAGYRAIQTLTFQSVDLTGPAPTGPDPPLPAGFRLVAKSDAKTLTSISAAQRPAEYARVMPASEREFFVSPLVAMGLQSETVAWVIDRGQGPEGFVRATSSAATESGNLTAPIFGPNVPPELATQLIQIATEWIRRRGPNRVVSEVPEYNLRGTAALASLGFTAKLSAYTMALPLHA